MLGQSSVKIELGEFNEHWEETRAAELTIPACMFNPHDVAVTADHAIFFSPQLAMDSASYLLGFKCPGQCIEFEDKPMSIYLQPRAGGPAQVCLSIPANRALMQAAFHWKILHRPEEGNWGGGGGGGGPVGE